MGGLHAGAPAGHSAGLRAGRALHWLVRAPAGGVARGGHCCQAPRSLCKPRQLEEQANAALVYVVGRTPWGKGLPLRVIVRLTRLSLSRRGMHDKLRVDYGPYMARGIAATQAALRASKARGAVARRFPCITCGTC